MTAFIAMVKLHIITGDALVRRRIPQRMSSHIVLSDHDAALQWVSAAETSIDNILSSLPYQLAPVQLWKYDSAEEERSLYGMQRANILITALAAKFVLVRLEPELTYTYKVFQAHRNIAVPVRLSPRSATKRHNYTSKAR